MALTGKGITPTDKLTLKALQAGVVAAVERSGLTPPVIVAHSIAVSFADTLLSQNVWCVPNVLNKVSSVSRVASTSPSTSEYLFDRHSTCRCDTQDAVHSNYCGVRPFPI